MRRGRETHQLEFGYPGSQLTLKDAERADGLLAGDRDAGRSWELIQDQSAMPNIQPKKTGAGSLASVSASIASAT